MSLFFTRSHPSRAAESACSPIRLRQVVLLDEVNITDRVQDQLCHTFMRSDQLDLIRVIVDRQPDLSAIIGINHSDAVRKAQALLC